MLRLIRTCPSLSTTIARAVLVLSTFSFGGCDRKPATTSAQVPVINPAPVEVRTPPLPPPPVGRAELLAAIAAARSAYAAGRTDDTAGLTGRRFAIRQAFGCEGATEARTTAGAEIKPGAAAWTWGRDHKTIEIRLKPADWAAEPVLTGETTWEAVEGYWLTRPWLQADGCPSERAFAAPKGNTDNGTPPGPRIAAEPTPQVSGLVAVFTQEGSRVIRRDGKPFALTLRGDPPLLPPANGYRLVIEGRFSAFSDGRSIRCYSSSINQEPACVAAAEVDRVAFEDADGKLLKEWRLG